MNDPSLPQFVLDTECYYCKNRVWKKVKENLAKCVKCGNELDYRDGK